MYKRQEYDTAEPVGVSYNANFKRSFLFKGSDFFSIRICSACKDFFHRHLPVCLVFPEFGKFQSLISVKHHADAPGIDKQEQRIALHILDLLHIGGAD